MKKLLILACMLWSVGANAQFTPGQVLTAAELNSQFALYAPLAGATFSGPVATTSTVNSTTPSTGSITTLGGLGVAQDVFVGGSMHGAAYITAGNISNTPISGSTGSFTTLSASSTVTLPAGSLPLTNLATQAANTIVANGTGSTASPTAISAPSCSTASSALQWTSGTGLACNSAINASTLGGATFASPGAIGSGTASSGAFTTLSASSTVSGAGFTNLFASPPTIGGTAAAAGSFTTLSSTGNFTPSQTNGIVGTTTNNNANAGSVGEYVTASVTTNTTFSLATATALCSVALTAGDWDVSGNAYYIAGSTNITQMVTSINTSATSAGPPFQQQQAITITSGNVWTQSPTTTRISLASPGTAYLVGFVNGTGTPSYQCFIRARRMR